MMQGLDVIDEDVSSAVRRTCVAHGLLIEAGGPNDEVIKVMAPLTTDEATLDRGLEILGSAVSLHADDPRATPVAG
jgi:diaminobutyrate-2-oxoglutarate transaminase